MIKIQIEAGCAYEVMNLDVMPKNKYRLEETIKFRFTKIELQFKPFVMHYKEEFYVCSSYYKIVADFGDTWFIPVDEWVKYVTFIEEFPDVYEWTTYEIIGEEELE
jgi:hypothetical protein